jgi:hypothetical protein
MRKRIRKTLLKGFAKLTARDCALPIEIVQPEGLGEPTGKVPREVPVHDGESSRRFPPSKDLPSSVR